MSVIEIAGDIQEKRPPTVPSTVPTKCQLLR